MDVYYGPYKNREDGKAPEVVVFRDGKELKKITLLDL